MLRYLLALGIFWVCLGLGAAQAQAPLTLAELQIAFWPEYDRPATLVIYQGTLASHIPLPASLQFQIPARYGPPIAMAYVNANGQLVDLEYKTTLTGETMLLSFTTPSAGFRFEYYDTSLALDTAARRYTFNTLAPYDIQSLRLQVQQPVDADNLSITPPLGSPALGKDGLRYYENTQANVLTGEALSLNLTYTKTTDRLSANVALVETPVLPPPSNPTPLSDPFRLLPIAAGVMGGILLIGGALWYWRSRAGDGPSLESARRRGKPKGHPPKPKKVEPTISHFGSISAESSVPPLWCHNCGQKSQPGDRFCRNCGTELRQK